MFFQARFDGGFEAERNRAGRFEVTHGRARPMVAGGEGDGRDIAAGFLIDGGYAGLWRQVLASRNACALRKNDDLMAVF